MIMTQIIKFCFLLIVLAALVAVSSAKNKNTGKNTKNGLAAHSMVLQNDGRLNGRISNVGGPFVPSRVLITYNKKNRPSSSRMYISNCCGAKVCNSSGIGTTKDTNYKNGSNSNSEIKPGSEESITKLNTTAQGNDDSGGGAGDGQNASNGAEISGSDTGNSEGDAGSQDSSSGSVGGADTANPGVEDVSGSDSASGTDTGASGTDGSGAAAGGDSGGAVDGGNGGEETTTVDAGSTTVTTAPAENTTADNSTGQAYSIATTSMALTRPADCPVHICPPDPCTANPAYIFAVKSGMLPPNVGSIAAICGKTYIFAQQPVNITDANTGCCSLGLKLASMETVDEMKCLADFVKKNMTTTKYWVSGTDFDCIGRYKWCSIDTAFDSKEKLWMANQPTKISNSTCVTVSFDSSGHGLANENCIASNGFICE